MLSLLKLLSSSLGLLVPHPAIFIFPFTPVEKINKFDILQ
jgi:hypothetical protein